MTAPARDRGYHAIRFQDGAESDAFVRALQRFLDSPRGEAFARNATETQIWAATKLSESPTELYLSDGALFAVESAFTPVPTIEPARGHDLPHDCVLLLQGSELQGE